MIHCPDCGPVPVPRAELPVALPLEVQVHEGQTLKDCESFVQAKCPVCQAPARRETDTFDTFFESSWYYARYASFKSDKDILDDEANYWLPVD